MCVCLAVHSDGEREGRAGGQGDWCVIIGVRCFDFGSC